MYIYLITNSATGKYYVGQHKGNNLRKYLQTKLSDAAHNRGGKSILYASMRKHPKSVWSIHPLISTLTTMAEVDYWETFFIAMFKARDPEHGYNICRGGERRGFGFAPWNKGMKGIRLNPATEFKKGVHHSPATEFKVGSRVRLGKPHSLESKRKMSVGHKGKSPWNKKYLTEKEAREAHKQYMKQWHLRRKSNDGVS